MMIKYIAYVYIAASGMTPINGRDYCEAKSVQSPYVKKLDDSTDRDVKFIPVNTCEIKNADAVEDRKAALLECIKYDTNWLKF